VHGDIAINKEEQDILDSSYLQRLRYIYQNSASYLVYPCATGSRFTHSLGVMDLATQMFKSAIENTKEQYPDEYGEFIEFCTNNRMKETFGIEIPENEIIDFLLQTLRFAALLHDVGHLPFSHATEGVFTEILGLKKTYLIQVLEMKPHEVIGLDVISKLDIPLRYTRSVILTLLADIWEVITSCYEKNVLEIIPDGSKAIFQELTKTPFYTLKKILSWEIDADRGDYLLRDGKISGVGFGFYDLDRLLYSLYLKKWNDQFLILPAERAQSTLESFITERYKLYKYVYQHKKVLLFNKILESAIKELEKTGKLENLKRNFIEKTIELLAGEFFNSLAAYLSGKENENIPHFMRGFDFYVNPDFLIRGGDGHFLDDSWLLIKLREAETETDRLCQLNRCFHRSRPFWVIYKNKTEENCFVEELCEGVGINPYPHLFNKLLEHPRCREEVLNPWLKEARELLENQGKGIFIWSAIDPQKYWGDIENIPIVPHSFLIRSIVNEIKRQNLQETALWLGFIPFDENASRDDAIEVVKNTLIKLGQKRQKILKEIVMWIEKGVDLKDAWKKYILPRLYNLIYFHRPKYHEYDQRI